MGLVPELVAFWGGGSQTDKDPENTVHGSGRCGRSRQGCGHAAYGMEFYWRSVDTLWV